MKIMHNLTNYHSHSLYCDGRAGMRDFVRMAVSRGFTSYGFSSHAPLPFPTHWSMEWDRMDDYLSEFRRLKEQYADRIELSVGLEIDYLNEDSHPATARFQDLPLDYRIGSVHMVYDPRGELVDVDVTADAFHRLVDKHFGGDLERVVRLYYERMARMVQLGGFDIVGHADKIHYNAVCYRPGLMDEAWYDDLVNDLFSLIAGQGMQVEINTKARHDLGTFYPDERYFGRLHRMDIPLQVNSDAHYPDLINAGRPEALRALAAAGVTHVMERHAGQWQPCPILL